MPRPSSTSGSRLRSWREILLSILVLGVVLACIDRAALWAVPHQDADRWATREWWERKTILRRQFPTGGPDILVLGDSTASLGISASVLGPRAFNLSRSALSGHELAEYTEKLEGLGIPPPRLIVMTMTPEVFRSTHSAEGLVRDFYEEPNISQTLLFPGMRRLKFARVFRGEPTADPDFHIGDDGTMLMTLPVRPLKDWPTAGYPWLDRPAGFIRPYSFDALATFRARWIQKGTRVLWVFMPLEPEFRAQWEQRFHEDGLRYREGVQRLFGADAVDLSEGWVRDDFHDPTHLTHAASLRLTERLRDRLHPLGGAR